MQLYIVPCSSMYFHIPCYTEQDSHGFCYDPISKVNIMVCHDGICLLTFAVGAITKHITDNNDKTEAAGTTREHRG